MAENPAFLKEQILTYLGNKRALLGLIGQGVKYAKSKLDKDKLSCGDLFSGSGIVARFLKQHSNFIIANDIELYSRIANECYLYNADEEFKTHLKASYQAFVKRINKELKPGFITELYAPKDDKNIQKGERAFYTRKNAIFIDTARNLIDDLPCEMQKFFIAPLLYEASNRANTSGVFKGFYKNKQGIGQYGGEGQNALKRITGDILLKMPVFSNFSVPYTVFQKDANAIVSDLDTLDLVYLDPPYNQHPYSSNYFMLNLIAKNERPSEISKVSGISQDWNRSVYNQKTKAPEAFFDLINSLKARFVLISFNSEGFITRENFVHNLAKMGELKILEQRYNAFRGSRNLGARDTYVKEMLYVLQKA
ncbi:DNA adenine methylase [Campylobacter sp. RM9344]|uniref:site-specific DNA-methyltransferase (adenine-specific) n=1 Tax=Campylobacter californiensis TaxID=1032243 RepID=A0AAW3ZTB7_9BACT|nr:MULTISPECIES: DNA adenine methylase [unclassified Campylobacter]MBE2984165.1 DNA adenine methylase [Campylobacter sp. RM6883]MBE2986211.1 DNA adenine methylase [Campylobacter sp. RM12919]MBE2988208.1 DNA adenine methylase [Campylobacter sp. RM12920]MBE2995534.1 DNA adenine methylase [Campylobacter sp. RM6913]MBE3022634.1 DNA adenine methylase [Campylobacter sp. 7477a]MBE3029797.1 DNA adenine methylase [Campylobacter sp. RM9344]